MQKKLSSLCAVLLTVGFLSLSLEANAADFRNASWGMSKAQVIVSETLPFYQKSNDLLVYEASIAGLMSAVVYRFENGGLIQGTCFFLSADYPDKFLRDFEQIEQYMWKKHGRGNVSDTWHSNQFSQEPNMYGRAIALGQLEKKTLWVRESTLTGGKGSTIIGHSLSLFDGKLTHNITYQFIPVSLKSMR